MNNSIKIVQTLYLPENPPDPLSNNLGFLSPEFNWMGWALSCLQLKQYYTHVELYTNTAGHEVLINKLGLPYDKVNVVLDSLNFPQQLWAYPKLYTYSLQNEPFLHVDGDAFFWEGLSDETLNHSLVVQNIEVNSAYYLTILNHLKRNGIKLPESIQHHFYKGMPFAAYNAGIVGGTDIDFFKAYTSEAFEFVEQNYDKLQTLKLPEVNMIYEQVLLYCLSQQAVTEAMCYLPQKVMDMRYPGFADFENVRGPVKFIHLMGSFKQNPGRCYMLANRLRHDYPVYYYRIIAECKKSGINMHLNYYNAISAVAVTNHVFQAPAKMDWKSLYEHEKEQFAFTEQMFKNNSLLNEKFRVNSFLHTRTTSDNNIKYAIPLSYKTTYQELIPDQLDEILMDVLNEEKTFNELYHIIADCFEDTNTPEGKEATEKLLIMKLTKGLYSHLYEIRR